MFHSNFRDPVVYCVASAALTCLLSVFAEPLARATGLIDRPDGYRKLHASATPLVGGVVLLLPVFASSIAYFLLSGHADFVLPAVCAASCTFLVGLIDDRWGLSAVWRLLALTYIVFTIVSIEPLFVLHRFGLELFGVQLSAPLDPVAASITVLVLLGFVSACNMADGMNGQLLGSIVIWCLFIAHHLEVQHVLPFVALISSALVTVFFNLRGRLFSGSSGAYAASLLIGLGAIATYRLHKHVLAEQQLLMWFWLPVADCVRLMIGRALSGRSPFSGDRNHIHHILLSHMRCRYALAAYLALLAAPGAVAEFDLGASEYVLMGCLALYLAALSLGRFSRAVRAGHLDLPGSTLATAVPEH